jgi:hypothetical protein
MVFLTQTDGYQQMCDTNNNVIIKGFIVTCLGLEFQWIITYFWHYSKHGIHGDF